MCDKKVSSSLSKSTFEFDLSSIKTYDSNTNSQSIRSVICFDEKNFNQNAINIDEIRSNEHEFIYRSTRSSTDIPKNDDYSFVNKENHSKENRPIRIESALMTSDDYPNRLIHSTIDESRSIIEINMNRTIDRIKRNGSGDQNISSHFDDKQIEYLTVKDNDRYVTIEPIPLDNQPKIQYKSKKFIIISSSIFVCVVFLCLTIIIFIF